MEGHLISLVLVVRMFDACHGHIGLLSHIVIHFACRRVIMLFNRNLPTRCPKASLRAFMSWIGGMALSIRKLCAIYLGGNYAL